METPPKPATLRAALAARQQRIVDVVLQNHIASLAMKALTQSDLDEIAAVVRRAVNLFHTQAGLGMAIGATQSHISNLASGRLLISAVDSVRIERATNGAIKRHELRPDLWDTPRRARSLDRFADTPQRMLDVVRKGAALGWKPGDSVVISGTKLFDGEHVVGAALDELTPPTKGKQNGKARTGKREGKEKASGPKGRARTQRRKG